MSNAMDRIGRLDEEKPVMSLKTPASSRAFRHICPLYLDHGPRRLSVSLSLRLKTPEALPICEIRACAILGSNPKIRLSAQRLYFSSSFFMEAK